MNEHPSPLPAWIVGCVRPLVVAAIAAGTTSAQSLCFDAPFSLAMSASPRGS